MMRHELEIEAQATGEEFKANVFANDPNLYFELFEKQSVGQPEFGDEVTFPETDAEFHAMIASMRREGVID